MDVRDDLIGRVVGGYRIESRIGVGGMGEVYKAYDRRLDRQVALKLLPADLVSDPDRLRRFHTEARAASALNHPSILIVHDFGELDGRPFIVTELVEGQTLRERLLAGPLPLREAVDIAVQMSNALMAVHARGIVHRDIKPDNVMVRSDGYVKILDFGLAKDITTDRTELDHTQLGMVVGTPRYMSPEQARGLPLDARTDIFSLGIILYEMVTGRRPFDGPDQTAALVALFNDPPGALPVSVLEAAPSLAGITMRALAKDRDQRYQQMAELAGELKRLQLALEIGERTPPAPAKAHPVADTDSLHNLPVPPDQIVGRETEIAVIRRLFETEGVRLVVLTGPGGSGKTRVAIESSARLANRFSDGVWFVALAPLQDPALVPGAIAQALGLTETAQATYTGLLQDYLRPRDLLLVLDNFEQVVAAGPMVAELLAASPRVRVLVTSRAVLRIRGEYEVPVSPLRLPDLARPIPIEELERVESIALFANRARSVRPDFAITRENAGAIAEICTRLDGLPLALELAAARIRLLGPAAMLGRLARRLPLLTGGPRDLPERQQTLRDTIAWSYQLLTPDEQRLFARLAVLASFTLEAAEALCSEGNLPVFDAIDALVGGSLLRRQDAPDGSSRFSMLQTIAEFAGERLAERGEVEALRTRHAAFYLSLAEATAAPEAAEDPAARFDRVEAEHDNLRAAITWCISAGDAQSALRFGSALWRFWEQRGFVREGADQLERILAMPGAKSHDQLRATVAYAAGVLADAAGRYDTARRRFGENLGSARAASDQWGIANSLNNLGIVALRQGDHEAARTFYTESLSIWRQLGHRHAIALSLNNLGNVADLQKDYERAGTLYRRQPGRVSGSRRRSRHRADAEASRQCPSKSGPHRRGPHTLRQCI